MSYLLIDLEKSAVQLNRISAEAGAVFLFAKRTRNQRLAKEFAKHHRATKVVKVDDKEKVSDVLLAKMKKILKADANAGIVVVSKREKVAKLVDKLLNRYPDAEIVLIDKAEKNEPVLIQPEVEVLPAPNADTAPKYLEKPAEVPLLEVHKEGDALFQSVLLLIRKHRPKKKDALIHLIINALHVDVAKATALLADLQETSTISIDKAENVKYHI